MKTLTFHFPADNNTILLLHRHFDITNEEVKPVILWVKDLFIQWVRLHSEESG